MSTPPLPPVVATGAAAGVLVAGARLADGRAGGGVGGLLPAPEQEAAEPAEGEHYDDEQQTLLPAGQFHAAAPLLVPASRPQPERHWRRPFRRRRCRSRFVRTDRAASGEPP